MDGVLDVWRFPARPQRGRELQATECSKYGVFAAQEVPRRSSATRFRELVSTFFLGTKPQDQLIGLAGKSSPPAQLRGHIGPRRLQPCNAVGRGGRHTGITEGTVSPRAGSHTSVTGEAGWSESKNDSASTRSPAAKARSDAAESVPGSCPVTSEWPAETNLKSFA